MSMCNKENYVVFYCDEKEISLVKTRIRDDCEFMMTRMHCIQHEFHSIEYFA